MHALVEKLGSTPAHLCTRGTSRRTPMDTLASPRFPLQITPQTLSIAHLPQLVAPQLSPFSPSASSRPQSSLPISHLPLDSPLYPPMPPEAESYLFLEPPSPPSVQQPPASQLNTLNMTSNKSWPPPLPVPISIWQASPAPAFGTAIDAATAAATANATTAIITAAAAAAAAAAELSNITWALSHPSEPSISSPGADKTESTFPLDPKKPPLSNNASNQGGNERQVTVRKSSVGRIRQALRSLSDRNVPKRMLPLRFVLLVFVFPFC